MTTTESMSGEASSALFNELGLSGTLLAAVDKLGYETPTPVQAQSIPEVLAGRDLLAAAQTGTGKTAAFLLPTMDDLPHVARARKGKAGEGPFMLVVTPTRELAQQIEDVCRTIAAFTKHSCVTVVGGVGYNPQINGLRRGCDILIATPGRLIDLMEQGAARLDQVRVLVLDEADRMLDMGFLPAVRRIVEATPEERQTLLFSATLDDQVVGAITDLVKDPARVEIAPATKTADTVEQYVLAVSPDAKNALLTQILKKEGTQRVIVFTRTKHRADACRRRLERAGITCDAIHGDRSQNQRERALQAFRAGKCDVLVATDVLSRGIDITGVRYVVNFDVPVEPADYIHRIGRTGRAGDVGWSLTFVTDQDVAEFYDIETLIGKTAQTYDAAGLDLGENPVQIDPDRVPGTHLPSKKAKARRNRARKALQRKAASKQAKAQPNEPAHAKRIPSAADGERPGADGAGIVHAERVAKVPAKKAPAARKAAVKKTAAKGNRRASAKASARRGKAPSPKASRPGARMRDPEVAAVEAQLKREARSGRKRGGRKQAAGASQRSWRSRSPQGPSRSRQGSPRSQSHSSSQIRTRSKNGRFYS